MNQYAPRNENEQARFDKLFPNQEPKNVRIYHNRGRGVDHYTVVFTGRYPSRPTGYTEFLTMCDKPGSPQGLNLFDSHPGLIDIPKYAHLGKRIKFTDLPEACRKETAATYLDLWQL